MLVACRISGSVPVEVTASEPGLNGPEYIGMKSSSSGEGAGRISEEVPRLSPERAPRHTMRRTGVPLERAAMRARRWRGADSPGAIVARQKELIDRKGQLCILLDRFRAQHPFRRPGRRDAFPGHTAAGVGRRRGLAKGKARNHQEKRGDKNRNHSLIYRS